MRSSKKISNSKKNSSQLKRPLSALSAEEEILLSGILRKPREFLIAHLPELRLSPKQKLEFAAKKQGLARGLPLAYLQGFRWFYGRKFTVKPGVLIPRPETELLVERALELAKLLPAKKLIDVGTGSGAIIISLRKELSSPQSHRPSFHATDISAEALKVARQNAKSQKASGIKFQRGNLLAPLQRTLKNAQNVLICANLPYLSKKELREPSIKHEPRLALYGGGAIGLAKIEQLLRQISKLNLKNSAVLLEINYNQAQKIKKLAEKLLPQAHFQIHKDLNNLDRIIQITIP